jgi:hypothetical protein
MSESRLVHEECTAWTTTKHKKTQELVSDANAKPVVLQSGTVVVVSGLLLDVEPRSLLVHTPDGQPLEIREHFLRAP